MRVVTWFAIWAGFLALWFLFVFQFSVSELLVGAGCATLTTVSALVSVRAVSPCFRPKAAWLVQAWRLPGMVLADLWVLLKDLLRRFSRRRSRSRFALVNLPARAHDCQTAAKRALAILFVSTSPNSVVLDVYQEDGQMLLHQLEIAPAPKLLKQLRG